MKTVIQRVNFAKVEINGILKDEIGKGLLVLVGFEVADNQEDIAWMVKKIVNMRIFSDENGKMNLSVKDIGGDIMIISQFTLHASTKKGNRPSFIRAAKPDIAIPLYEKFISETAKELGKEVATGEFGAYMKISFENDGPVTIAVDSKNKD